VRKQLHNISSIDWEEECILILDAFAFLTLQLVVVKHKSVVPAQLVLWAGGEGGFDPVQWALKILPKLEAGLNETQAARRGSLNSDTDEDTPPPEPDFD
jgi:hypothetical protein